jgi:hypothetical protein
VKPAFAEGVVWTQRDTEWSRGERCSKTVDGVQLTAQSRWWGKQWKIAGESDFAVPEKMILFVSERGMDHGYWRDLLVGDAQFDARYFIFCDTPALLPIILGARTRDALRDSDIELYVRDNRVKTTSTCPDSDAGAFERHVAVHLALANDHHAFLASWKARMDDAQGRGDAVWPPTATLIRPTGKLTVNLAWTAPTTRDASDWDAAAQSMRTEITAHDDKARAQWSLREVDETTPCTHVLAGRRFVLAGKLPFAVAQLETIVDRAQLATIAVRENRITVGVHGVANARQIDGAVRIVHLVVQATVESTSPYR